jgi:hypothetical protein
MKYDVTAHYNASPPWTTRERENNAKSADREKEAATGLQRGPEYGPAEMTQMTN